ncbi:MAG TPA: 16S rRNA (cytosine(1402)-N(4))-methyltransferase [Betaproteobacteria bacterium]|nr:16S rRNA (cytosine(1402)-N(4))-methyltransferase [Betaproteobacteria bacterium]
MNESPQHRAVLLHEAIEALHIQPAGVYVDGTFGRGGHSHLILQQLGANGRLIALDRDLDAVAAGAAITDRRFQLLHRSFGELKAALAEVGVGRVDGVLLDLGVSSPQLDCAERGFSFRCDGPLDMRMDVSRGQTAAEWLATATEAQLGEVIKRYGEERFAKQIAKAIVSARAIQPIATTKRLAAVVAKAVKKREPGQDPATRTFQAIRIFLNRELEELSLVLPQCLDVLADGGRLVVISFHSLEDRIVKHFMRDMAKPNDMPDKLPLRANELAPPKMRLIGKRVRPSATEVSANARARSAVMRVAERACIE